MTSDQALPFGPRSAPKPERIIRHLLRANEVAVNATAQGHHPFGCILVAPDDETVLMSQGNVSTVEHAEAVLARRAAIDFSPAYLWLCTLYTTVEPCAMCAGTAYWANIGCVVFGMAEERLLVITGSHPANPTLNVPARYIFDHGQKPVVLIGPVPEVNGTIEELHRLFWNKPA